MSFGGSRRGARRPSGAGAIDESGRTRLSPTSIDSWNFSVESARRSKIAATEIIDKVQVLSEHPQLGRPIAGREEYRQIVLQVLGAAYVFQYRFDGLRLVMLRVYHARESRK
jgi:plasmid stabilization system protein ParE